MYFVILDFDDNGQAIALPCSTKDEAFRLLDTYICKRWVTKEVKRPTKRVADASPESPLKNKRQVAKRR